MNKKILIPSLLAVAVSTSLSAAEFEFAGDGTLKIGGDLELDTDFRSDSDAAGQDRDKFDQGGRILIDIEAEKTFGNNYAKVKAQPLVGFDGDMGVDDAYVEFGAREDWSFRAGRYEAIDLFPMGQDTIVDFIKQDEDGNAIGAGGEIYKLSEGRGRADDAGQLMVTKQFGNFYTELGTLIGNAREMAINYGHVDLNKSENTGEYTAVVRPAVQYRGEGWDLTAGVEYFVSDQTIETQDGRDLDLSGRLGYGMTFAYKLPYGVINTNIAQLDADDMESTSYGVNTIINQWGVGYVYGENSYSGVLNNEKDTEINSLYGSYIVQNLVGVDNMEMHLGLFYSWGELEGSNDDNEIAGRVRFKYYF